MPAHTKRRVLDAAGPIFADKGFESATVREICAAADTNLASINYHFGDKEKLYLETVQLAHSMRMDRTPLPTVDATMSREDKLRLFIESLLRRMLGGSELRWQARLMIREMIQPTIACRPLVEDFIRPQLDMLLMILSEFLPADCPEYRRYQIAFSIIGQCLHYRVANEFVVLLIPAGTPEERFDIDSLAEHIFEFSLGAILSVSRKLAAGSNVTHSRA